MRPRRLAKTAVRRAITHLDNQRSAGGGARKGTQVALMLAYQERLASGRELPALVDTEFRNLSQNGEDGILLFIFALAGMGHRRAVEICAGDGIECNSANLIVHHGWSGLLVDGDVAIREVGARFYSDQPETFRTGPILEQAWVTRDNAQGLLERHGFAEDLDLLTLDMDGNDYWILESLTVRPRVLVCEYNNRIPPGNALSVPYAEEFVAEDHDLSHGKGFFGASLAAFVRLLQPERYRLVGANQVNTNAFFLRNDVLPDALPEVSEESCLSSEWARRQQAKWWPELSSLPWTEL